MNPATLVQKLWNYSIVLRDDGMSQGDWVEPVIFAADGDSDGQRVGEREPLRSPPRLIGPWRP